MQEEPCGQELHMELLLDRLMTLLLSQLQLSQVLLVVLVHLCCDICRGICKSKTRSQIGCDRRDLACLECRLGDGCTAWNVTEWGSRMSFFSMKAIYLNWTLFTSNALARHICRTMCLPVSGKAVSSVEVALTACDKIKALFPREGACISKACRKWNLLSVTETA